MKKPPQNVKATIAGEIYEVLEVNVEPPQIDISTTWEMFIDGAKKT